MNLPGFTAEVSLGRSGGRYRTRGTATGTDGLPGVTPQALNRTPGLRRKTFKCDSDTMQCNCDSMLDCINMDQKGVCGDELNCVGNACSCDWNIR